VVFSGVWWHLLVEKSLKLAYNRIFDTGNEHMSDIENKVKDIVVEQLDLDVSASELNNSASFVDDLGADSLDTVELVMALEEEFECEIPEEDAEKITTVQQAIDYVTANV